MKLDYKKYRRIISENKFWSTYISILITSGVLSSLGYLFDSPYIGAWSIIYAGFTLLSYSASYNPIEIKSKSGSKYESFTPKSFQYLCFYVAHLFYPIAFIFGFLLYGWNIILNFIGIITENINFPLSGTYAFPFDLWVYATVVVSSLLYMIFIKVFMEAACTPTENKEGMEE